MTPQIPTMNHQQFIAKWRNVQFGEKQASQEMFLDLCALVGHPTPVSYGNADAFTFEKWVPGGFADAYLEDRFGWEFKGGDDQLPGAFNQLLRYQVYLKTPPLLIVSSFRQIQIRTNFPGMETVLHEIPIGELEHEGQLAKLRNCFFAPDEFRPNRSEEDVTRETAELFRDIVADMEQHIDRSKDGDPERLARVTVLDPACGSGNFLYLALRGLLDLEKRVIDYAAMRGWHGLTPAVKPNQMLGLEINPYAAELARTALWIGYIQWHQSNGFPYTQNPILTPLDTIRQTDAILDLSAPEHPTEPEWPAAEFIVGNPPFLGSQLIRGNLPDTYTDYLFQIFGDRIPNYSDLCCYWFEKARQMVDNGRAKRVGLLATQGIRGGANRRVLERIKESGDIFAAHSDRPWVLDGAAVRVSIVCFDDGRQDEKALDDHNVTAINANLTAGVDLTKARRLPENAGRSFIGDMKKGKFEIDAETAATMLETSGNPNGRPNSDVVRPWVNALDITQASTRHVDS